MFFSQENKQNKKKIELDFLRTTQFRRQQGPLTLIGHISLRIFT